MLEGLIRQMSAAAVSSMISILSYLKVVTHRNMCTGVSALSLSAAPGTICTLMLPYFSCRMRRRQQAGDIFTLGPLQLYGIQTRPSVFGHRSSVCTGPTGDQACHSKGLADETV